MAKLTKEQVQKMIDGVKEGLAAENYQDNYSYYNSIYPDDLNEYDLANGLVEYPELIPQGEEIVEMIIDTTRAGRAYDIWVHDEEQAGSPITYALAMYDKKYCKLFAKMLANQELDHEVDQNNQIKKIIDKWGICPEVLIILDARISNEGQWGFELVEELEEEGLLKGTKFEGQFDGDFDYDIIEETWM